MKKMSLGHQHLIRRYLLWAYKSTKESFERIERKTTQLIVDEYILNYLKKKKCNIPPEFRAYIAKKKKEELELKSNPEYVYLKNRLSAIESAVRSFLGNKELKRIEELYEAEFSRRILEARDH